MKLKQQLKDMKQKKILIAEFYSNDLGKFVTLYFNSLHEVNSFRNLNSSHFEFVDLFEHVLSLPDSSPLHNI